MMSHEVVVFRRGRGGRLVVDSRAQQWSMGRVESSPGGIGERAYERALARRLRDGFELMGLHQADARKDGE